jgi:hypothetical protein
MSEKVIRAEKSCRKRKILHKIFAGSKIMFIFAAPNERKDS